MIADFEDGTDTEVVQGGRTGWFFSFADTLGGSIMQAPNQAGPIPTAMLPAGDPAIATCNHYAFHVTATGRMGGNTMAYAGFGTTLAQIMPTPPAGSKTKNPYDVSTFKGISFSIKSGTGSPPPIWFEFINTETQGTPDGTASVATIDLYNTRGKLFTDITTSWQTKVVPFGLMGPRYLPACTTLPATACNDAHFYEAPAFNNKSALGIQLAMYPQFTSATAFDIWIDNIQFVTDDSPGVATFTPSTGTMKAFPRDAAVGSCAKPAGAAGKYLVDAYNRWKSTFVTGTGNNTRVQRPENGNDTVSEGIGYGMLISVMMGDKTTFDGLWGYWAAHPATGMLMNWTCPGGTGCSGGSATDADEDAAYALLLASKQWGGSPAGGSTSYLSLATTMIGQIWSAEIDTGSMLPKGGNMFGSVNPTNPSYFAPAYYRIFGMVDTAHPWSGANGADGGVVAAVYKALGNSGVNHGGLVPAWCTGTCTGVGSNGAADDGFYQYDAHRVPWRIGIDACWNNNASAKSFLATNTAFFMGKSQKPSGQASGGLGSVVDIYTLTGSPNTDAKVNSMSAVGSAGVGAMANASGSAATQDFLDRAYRFILDANYTSDPPTKSAYTYFNASVGLMTALTMSGNFPDYRNF
jgi:endo-1,4-beta-D-glucanase Y